MNFRCSISLVYFNLVCSNLSIYSKYFRSVCLTLELIKNYSF